MASRSSDTQNRFATPTRPTSLDRIAAIKPVVIEDERPEASSPKRLAPLDLSETTTAM